MKLYIKVENRYLTFFEIETYATKQGFCEIQNEWKKVERFIYNSNFLGKQKLIVTMFVNNEEIFINTKMKLKKERYYDIFYMFLSFLEDKIYFYHMLEKDKRTKKLDQEYIRNLHKKKLLQRIRYIEKRKLFYKKRRDSDVKQRRKSHPFKSFVS